MICENAITTFLFSARFRRIPARRRGLNFSAPFQPWSPILNYALPYQARLKFHTDGLTAGFIRFIIHHNL
ncbi:hypothetical protein AXX16_3091 [Serratia rubidaea]|nr:hypothetical protein AXX16_3091 [Serratia rubidaea]